MTSIPLRTVRAGDRDYRIGMLSPGELRGLAQDLKTISQGRGAEIWEGELLASVGRFMSAMTVHDCPEMTPLLALATFGPEHLVSVLIEVGRQAQLATAAMAPAAGRA